MPAATLATTAQARMEPGQFQSRNVLASNGFLPISKQARSGCGAGHTQTLFVNGRLQLCSLNVQLVSQQVPCIRWAEDQISQLHQPVEAAGAADMPPTRRRVDGDAQLLNAAVGGWLGHHHAAECLRSTAQVIPHAHALHTDQGA
jgi:hypothetical protein